MSSVMSFDQFFVLVIIEMNCSSGMATTWNAVLQAHRFTVGFFPFRQLIILSTGRNAHRDSRSTHQSVGNGRHWRIHLQNKQWIFGVIHQRNLSFPPLFLQFYLRKKRCKKMIECVVFPLDYLKQERSFLKGPFVCFLFSFSCENIGVKFLPKGKEVQFLWHFMVNKKWCSIDKALHICWKCKSG